MATTVQPAIKISALHGLQTLPEVKVIHRADIPELRSVVVDSITHNLGILKDFRKHPDLVNFIPENTRTSLAWVHLGSGEELAVHVHPTASMVIVAHGDGYVTGDLEAPITTGDIVAIPAGRHHGFRGAEQAGLWALSIQFEGAGLYENLDNARVQFAGDANPGFHELMRRNEEFTREFREKNPLHTLLDSGKLSQPSVRKRFFDALEVFSVYFQRALFARSAVVDDKRYLHTYREHLAEEFGHDEKLAKDIKLQRNDLWDPVLDATSNWFVWKMLTLDNTEKVVLMSLILEVSSDVFSSHARESCAEGWETDYFDIHAVADVTHQQAGLPQLKRLDEETYERLFQVQREGWDMLNVMAGRLAYLAERD